MTKLYNIDTLDPMRFMARLEERRQKAAAAPAVPLPKEYGVNNLAQRLHPAKQFLKVS